MGHPKNKDEAMARFGKTAWWCFVCQAWHGKEKTAHEKQQEITDMEEKIKHLKQAMSNVKLRGRAL